MCSGVSIDLDVEENVMTPEIQHFIRGQLVLGRSSRTAPVFNRHA
jgi:hypothetical protein